MVAWKLSSWFLVLGYLPKLLLLFQRVDQPIEQFPHIITTISEMIIVLMSYETHVFAQ